MHFNIVKVKLVLKTLNRSFLLVISRRILDYMIMLKNINLNKKNSCSINVSIKQEKYSKIVQYFSKGTLLSNTGVLIMVFEIFKYSLWGTFLCSY